MHPDPCRLSLPTGFPRQRTTSKTWHNDTDIHRRQFLHNAQVLCPSCLNKDSDPTSVPVLITPIACISSTAVTQIWCGAKDAEAENGNGICKLWGRLMEADARGSIITFYFESKSCCVVGLPSVFPLLQPEFVETMMLARSVGWSQNRRFRRRL